jgi:hypothetical protein
MSATNAPRAIGTSGIGQTGAEPSVPSNGGDVHGARMLFVDMGVRSLVMGEARRGVVTRIFGIPRDEQSFLVTMIMFGAAATVVRGFAPRPWPHPTGADLKIGGSLLNATFRGIAGAPSGTMHSQAG